VRAPWPALGTLVFSILVPGFVAIWLPIRLGGHGQPPATIARAAGWLVLAAGVALYLLCASRFVRAGGTPAPIAPTRDLVSRGVYRYIRNPMYVSVLLAIFGQALAYGSRTVAIYGLCAWCFFFLFVLLYEEPALERQFGEPYREYCEQVPRWIPRLRRISRGK
jgi:protein-S-isoprenylcysteine O-methyltransferase Ste14